MSDDDVGSRPSILISNRQELPADEVELTRLARRTLEGERVSRGELSISLVDEDEMADLHERYMGEPGPTDVLSFSLDETDEDEPDAEDAPRLLGDVVIAPSVAARNNPRDPAGELRLLLVHGVLHLLGYDHEDAEERAQMWSRQDRYAGVAAP